MTKTRRPQPGLRWLLCAILLLPLLAYAALDVSSCPIGDEQCVERLYRIRHYQLQTELEELRVSSESRLESEDRAASQHRMSTLWAQYVAGWIMLSIGLCIILAGLVMSWLQMVKGWKDMGSLESAFELSSSGIKLKSPVIGLFIFVASIYFFQLYMSEVYKITDVIERNDKSLRQGDASTRAGKQADHPGKGTAAPN